MSENIFSKITKEKMRRRTFLKWSGAVTAPAVLGGVGVSKSLVKKASAAENNSSSEEVITATCSQLNCGGRCVIKTHVKDGVIERITTDDSENDKNADNVEYPQIRACVRGRNYRKFVYHPDRIQKPLKRVGKRGEGKFEEISWDEAAKIIAEETTRIKNEYGPASRYVCEATGQQGMTGTGDTLMKRLLCLDGGVLNRHSSYSAGAHALARPYTFGSTAGGGSTLPTLLDSKLIVLVGHNPSATIFGHLNMYLRMAKDRGIKIYVIDPRNTETVQGIADDWFPIRPTTDAALVAGMAYVMFTENLHDQAFLDKFCSGHDEDHMPEGAPKGESYKSYVMGDSDGVPKTPEWAAEITGLPAKRIIQLAREVATTKPMAWIQGNGVQRHMNGEQQSRSAVIIQAMTGNIGISGGWADPFGMTIGGTVPFPVADNPVTESINCFVWTDAITRGTEMGVADGVIGLPEGQETLSTNIKAIYNICGNALVNNHADVNKNIEILKDESLVEFIVTSDIFMTPSALYSDIILPSCTWFEHNDFVGAWSYGQQVYYSSKVIEPLYGSLSEFEWISKVAAELGLEQEFNEGKTQDEWVDTLINMAHEKIEGFPTLEELKQKGIHKFAGKKIVGFADQINDIEAHPFETPSGKIEIFSQPLYDLNLHEDVPAIPKYVAVKEGYGSELQDKYPLQLTSYHSKRRCHSTFDNIKSHDEVEENLFWINPSDAKKRGISNGDLVKIFNDRGTVKVKAKVTSRVMPGVTALSHGGWHTPDKDGVDTRGCVNVLTTHESTPFFANTGQHTNLIDVKKA